MALQSVFALPKDGGSLDKVNSRLVPSRVTQECAHLILSIKVDTSPSVEWNIPKRTGLVPTPREHGQGHRDRNINSYLPYVDLPLEFPCGSTRLSKDGGSITVLVLVDDLESLIESLGVEDDEHGSENLFVVAFHRSVGLDDGGSDEVSVWVSFHLDVTPVQDDLSALRFSGAN